MCHVRVIVRTLHTPLCPPDTCGANCKPGNCIGTNTCDLCIDGFMGPNCETACPLGYRGPDCALQCKLDRSHRCQCFADDAHQTRADPTVLPTRALPPTSAQRATRAGRAGTARMRVSLATLGPAAPLCVCASIFRASQITLCSLVRRWMRQQHVHVLNHVQHMPRGLQGQNVLDALPVGTRRTWLCHHLFVLWLSCSCATLTSCQ